LPESVHSYTTEGDELKIALNCLIGSVDI
jgi:hypothetical protein